MVTINNEDLRNVYHYVATIENVLQKEIKLINGNKSHLDKIVPEHLVKIYSLKEKTALAFTDQIAKNAYESSVVSLVSLLRELFLLNTKQLVGS